jgi:signal transduction histidine kinase/DNA-binding response OmpR family regulator
MILIVDDKAENIYSLKKLLEINNFDVDTALSGEEALKKVLRNTYALVILDVQMPGMDGFEVAEALSGYSKAKDIPIIFLSAVNTDKKFITKGYFSGGIDYVAKPVDPDILLLKVKTFYRLYEQTRELNNTQIALRSEIEVRKNAQNEQHKKASELQSILESMPQIAFTANPAGVIEYVNKEWYKYSDNKHTFPEVFPGQRLIAAYWSEAIVAGKPWSAEVCIKKIQSPEYRYHLLKITPVRQNDTIVNWVGTFTDINEQKLITEILEEKVRERTKELKEINEALEASNVDLQQFASVASHDLQEPLRKILVFSSIVRERHIEKVDPEVLSYLDKIIASSERMTRLINDLLTFSRLSVNSLFQFTDVNLILADILNDLEILIREKNAKINIAPIPWLEGIPGQLRQMFQNIISNALKFTRAGHAPVINVTAELVTAKDVDSEPDLNGTFCRIMISDNGIGFNEIYLDKIFTIFQRLNSREEYEGTGIGLAIAKKIVDKHNGIITARSKDNEGASFIIVLPVYQPLQVKENAV